MTAVEAARLAAELDLDVDDLPICLACLSVISMAIDGRDERTIRAGDQPDDAGLWAEGSTSRRGRLLKRPRSRSPRRGGGACGRRLPAGPGARGEGDRPRSRRAARRNGQGDLLRWGSSRATARRSKWDRLARARTAGAARGRAAPGRGSA